MLLELKFNVDTVISCEYPNNDQCTDNPLVQIWKDFNLEGDNRLQVISGDDVLLNSNNYKATNTELILNAEGEDNCLTGLGLEFYV